jgi:hypothetical protein
MFIPIQIVHLVGGRYEESENIQTKRKGRESINFIS